MKNGATTRSALQNALDRAKSAADDAELAARIIAAVKEYDAADATRKVKAIVAGDLLVEAQKRHPGKKEFIKFLELAGSIQYSRAQELIAIAIGRKAFEQQQADNAARQKRHRDKLKAEKIEREKAEAAMPKPEPAEPEPVRYGNGPQVDLDQQADRLKALWKSGRDKYSSFFAVLEEVRQVIGDAALASWCYNELRIGLSVITTTKDILRKADAARVKSELAAAKAAAKKPSKMRNGKMISVVELIEKLTPIITKLKKEGLKNMATASPAAVAVEAGKLQNFLDAWKAS